MEEKLAHLGFIQAVITRMASNCFLVKGWSISLVAAIFVLSARDADKDFMAVAYFPILVFWVLDAYYFRQEKLFRALYDAVVDGQPAIKPLSFDTSPVAGKVDPLAGYIVSKGVAPLHGTLAIALLLANAWLRH